MKRVHDVIETGSHIFLIPGNKPHSRKYYRLKKKADNAIQEMIDDALIALGEPDHEAALKAFEEKYGFALITNKE